MTNVETKLQDYLSVDWIKKNQQDNLNKLLKRIEQIDNIDTLNNINLCIDTYDND